MEQMAWKVYIETEDFNFRARLLVGNKSDDGSIEAIVGPVTIHRFQPHESAKDAHFLDMPSDEMRQFLQAIVDAAWDFGVRASEYAQHSGAQQKHLADMRKLVGKAHGVEL